MADVMVKSMTVESMIGQGAAVPPRLSARAWSECKRTIVEARDAGWRIELPKKMDGENRLQGPAVLLLGALAASVATIQDTIAPEKGVQVYSVRTKVSCGTDGPDFQDILLEIDIESSASEEALQNVVQAWREQSPVYLSLSWLDIAEKVRAIDPYAGA